MKKRILIYLLITIALLCSCSVNAENASISSIDPRSNAIEKGWIAEEEFNENPYLTRAQAIKTLMRMAPDLEDVNGKLKDFADTGEHLDQDVIRKARNYGIIKGDRQNRFHPDNAITKGTLIAWMDKIFDLPDTVNFENSKAKDNDKWIDPEAYYAINKYLELKIIYLDSSGKFQPRAKLTMDDFATIIDRLSGVGIKNLKPVDYEGETQQETILQPH